jgi:protein O-mannosyl-transferase
MPTTFEHPGSQKNGSIDTSLKFGIGVAVGLAAVIAFLPVITNGFVDQWDDQTNFLYNDNFRGLGWPQLRWAFTTTLQGVYQPLAWMLFEAEYVAWGLDPMGYHLASLALHAADAVLFFVLTQVLVSRALSEIEPGRRWVITLMSGLAAVLFAVHPFRVEVVAWTSCQPYLPCAGLAIMSVLAYVRCCGGDRRRLGWFLASIALYTAALGCHGLPVGLPLVLLVLDVAVLKRLGAGRSAIGVWIEKIPYVVVAIAFGYIAVKTKADIPRISDDRPGPARLAAERIAMAGYGLEYYLEKTGWPRDLSAYNFRPEPIDLTEPRFAVSLAIVMALAVAAYRLRRRRPVITAALLTYAILLAPNLGLVSYGHMLVADRYAYFATMPIFVLAAGGLARSIAVGRRPRTVALAICVAGLGLIVLLTKLSWAQCRTWRDSEALREHALRIGSGRDALLETNLGVDLLSTGRVEEGIAHMRKAIQIDPNNVEAHENLGAVYFRLGDVTGAVNQFSEAVRVAPQRFEARYRFGLALVRGNRLPEAALQLAEAVRILPDSAEAHVGLGGVLAALERRGEAANEFAEALRLDPGHEGARQSLAELMRQNQRP